MKYIFLGFVFVFFSINLGAQQLSKEWAKNYGGTAGDRGVKILEAYDGNYMVLSTVGSSDIDVDTTNGGFDVWLVKINPSGDILWETTFGGSSTEYAMSICHAHDSGYVILATTSSNDGDVVGHHDNSWRDIWVIKCDLSGTIQWQKCLGGTNDENASSIRGTVDGGYIICGSTLSNDGDVSTSIGMTDLWVVKIDSFGNLIWESTIGGSSDEGAIDIIQTADSGYLVVGQTHSVDGHVTQNIGMGDYWLVKMDSLGQYQWDRAFGTMYNDKPVSISEGDNNTYLLLGSVVTSGVPIGDVSQPKGFWDAWLVHIDANGNLLSEYSFGGSDRDEGIALSKVPGGGYVLFSKTRSSDGDVTSHIGMLDFWISRLDTNFTIISEKCFGSLSSELMTSGTLISDGSILSIGYSMDTGVDIDDNYGWEDVWIIKLQANAGVESMAYQLQITLFPNPARETHTLRFEGVADEAVTIELYDVLGRNQGVVYRGKCKEINEIHLPIYQLEKGMYYYKLRTTSSDYVVNFTKIE